MTINLTMQLFGRVSDTRGQISLGGAPGNADFMSNAHLAHLITAQFLSGAQMLRDIISWQALRARSSRLHGDIARPRALHIRRQV